MQSTAPLNHMSLTAAADAIRNRRVTCTELTESCLEAIERLDSRLRCFITVTAGKVLADARMLDRQLAEGNLLGPLHGVPLAHKDLFYREGRISTGGSEVRSLWQADRTATVLVRLDQAGALELGTLNMSEFAAGPTGHNRTYGDCRNAWDVYRAAGGSSSGSGSAVAARMIFASLGTDTGGSIRIPAGANGVTGLKPTYGRVSRCGVMPRSWSLDHVGPIARTAEDCATMLSVIAGADGLDLTASTTAAANYSDGLGQGIHGIRIGMPANLHELDLDSEIHAALVELMATMAAGGSERREVSALDFSDHSKVAETIIKSEAASMHAPWLSDPTKFYTPHVRSRIEAGRLIPAGDYLNALRLRGHLLDSFLNDIMGGVDALIYPVLAGPLPLVTGMNLEDTGPEVVKLISRLTMFTRPFNLLGLPAIILPCGFMKAGHPIGVQIVGRPFSEKLLLRLAHNYQQRTDHHLRAPEIANGIGRAVAATDLRHSGRRQLRSFSNGMKNPDPTSNSLPEA